ncbi:ABC transporter ATP-binding protein [Paenarthrobacter nitroguajacolicus]|uniref:ABC transporter ATP-binding protein n=1 Tax=Paenarthrobacter nitroguajacolicus TaxID=211146 RepID=UPI000AB8C7F5|nr:ABC transporter ATP-binding protein [Paenarthrobacter nitroguajacolicus]
MSESSARGTSNRHLLEVRQVSRRFGGFVAVDNVTLNVSEGEILGIAGPNGAGKSTLFNLISGVPFGPTGGEILFDGIRIGKLPAHKIARSGMRRTFQAEQLFPSLSVSDNIAVANHYLGGRGRYKGDVETALETVGITRYRDDKAADIPLLAKKKLMIASALVSKPRLLMLDEPAGGLNDEDQAELILLLRELQKGGLTLLIIEHVLSLIRDLAKRMIIMSSGEVLVEGTPDAVLADPRVMEAYLGKATA